MVVQNSNPSLQVLPQLCCLPLDMDSWMALHIISRCPLVKSKKTILLPVLGFIFLTNNILKYDVCVYDFVPTELVNSDHSSLFCILLLSICSVRWVIMSPKI